MSLIMVSCWNVCCNHFIINFVSITPYNYILCRNLITNAKLFLYVNGDLKSVLTCVFNYFKKLEKFE
jgi:hypothetical protein